MSLIKRAIRKIKRDVRAYQGSKLAKELNLTLEKPNYIYQSKFNKDSVVIDVGCADDPDLSLHFIKKFDVFAYGVDPTKKHFPSLKRVEQENSKFKHLPYAVADKKSKLVFYESVEHHSGSLLKNHNNVQNDSIVEYEVDALTIPDVIAETKMQKVDYLKIDLEGAEFALLEKIKKKDVENVDQLFIEFHHHCIDDKTIQDTNKLVEKISAFGYRSFTIDGANYLFFKD